MLASTVQFSNNDQTSTLCTRRHIAWRRHPRGNTSFPQDPTACPTQDHHPSRSTPKQY